MPHAVNDGVRIHFETSGTGPALLLHHGRLENGDVWKELGYVQALQPGRRIVLVDARGHGRSDKPTDTASYAARTMASDMVAVLDALGIDRADVLGYSMGGRIGFMGLAYFPERFASLIAGGAGPYGPAISREHELTLAASLATGMAGYLAQLEAMLKQTLPTAKRRVLLANDAPAMAALTTQVAEWSSVVPAVRASGLPVQLYGGTADPIWPRVAQAHQDLPGSRLAALEGLGHADAPLQVARVVSIVEAFLAGRT